ncbi:MAG TPA: hypothetical protein PLM53_05285 [Spirochaetota bacterium]|nr:hypothetical protein [Spirochaetota bacterium]HPC40561.1 hypothetical protein [Spirochaetota bacterium]HPL18386.1 hypothetical protein [Spirochaetota bacterium]HQF07931.1 hypothetical protein [Spirochaetota bacterium]HQH96491.1 hypothetical protein [Spirochaetota bacterium]
MNRGTSRKKPATASGVEMRSRFWIGGNLRVNWLPERSPVNRPVNSRLVRRLALPRDAALQMALHCAHEYNNLAAILPELYRDYGKNGC